MSYTIKTNICLYASPHNAGARLAATVLSEKLEVAHGKRVRVITAPTAVLSAALRAQHAPSVPASMRADHSSAQGS
eukprot:4369025-Pleurochrysis_carterae.AAC.1